MLLEQKIIPQLNKGSVLPQEAKELGLWGYTQWLCSLPETACQIKEAEKAHSIAAPFIEGSPAIAVFCTLLKEAVSAKEHLPRFRNSSRRRGRVTSRRMLH